MTKIGANAEKKSDFSLLKQLQAVQIVDILLKCVIMKIP